MQSNLKFTKNNVYRDNKRKQKKICAIKCKIIPKYTVNNALTHVQKAHVVP